MSPPRIAIIGAGPAGCTLGRILSRSSIPFIIFEADRSDSYRNQGGSLDLHAEMGLKALKLCGLEEESQKLARYDGEAIALLRQNKEIIFKTDGHTAETSNGRPEFDRTALRRMLLDSLPANSVKWDHRVKAITLENGKAKIEFLNGTVVDDFDLVIGAEGAWSKTRRALTSETPFYAGVTGWTGWISNAEQRCPELTKLVNRGSLFAAGDHTLLVAQWTGEGTIYFLVLTKEPEDFAEKCGFDVKDPAAIRKHLHTKHSYFHEDLRAIWDAVDDDSFEYRSMRMLPIGFNWEHQKGATIIGDAAHLMTQFAGVGVNLAMIDAADLAASIIAGGESLEDVDKRVAEFEQQMCGRARFYAQLTYDNMNDQVLAEDAGTPAAFIRIMARMKKQPGADDFALIHEHFSSTLDKETNVEV